MLVTILLAIVLLAVAFTGMAINIIVKKNGSFPKTRIGQNKKMREKGIECAFTQDYKAQNNKDNWKRPLG